MAWLVPRGRAGGLGCFLSFVLIYPNTLDRAAEKGWWERGNSVSQPEKGTCPLAVWEGKLGLPPVCVTSKFTSAFTNGTVDIAAPREPFVPDVFI